MKPIAPHIDIHTTSHPFIDTNVSLAPLTWFKTGGNARYFATPSTAQEFAQSVQFARENELAVFILGEGANILVSDEGFDGIVIKPKLTNISHTAINNENALVTAQAGASLARVIEYCLENQLIGLEEFSGIPGTIGGSVYINLHYFEFLLEQFLVHAHVMHAQSGIIEVVNTSWFNFGYNQSKLQDGDYYLIDATFNVKHADLLTCAYARGRRQEIIRHRMSRYPNAATCGSFFRNFHPHELEHCTDEKKLKFVAYYLDKIGVKGALSIGDAMVSYQHANMIVNHGDATSTDIIGVARTMQERVYKEFNIIPVAECLLIGFAEYPLLQA